MCVIWVWCVYVHLCMCTWVYEYEHIGATTCVWQSEDSCLEVVPLFYLLENRVHFFVFLHTSGLITPIFQGFSSLCFPSSNRGTGITSIYAKRSAFLWILGMRTQGSPDGIASAFTNWFSSLVQSTTFFKLWLTYSETMSQNKSPWSLGLCGQAFLSWW